MKKRMRNQALAAVMGMCLAGTVFLSGSVYAEEVNETEEIEAGVGNEEDYRIWIPEDFLENYFVYCGNPELTDPHSDAYIASLWLEAARETECFEGEAMGGFEKENLKAYLVLDTEEADERLREKLQETETKERIAATKEEGYSFFSVAEEDSGLEFSGTMFAVLFCDEASNELSYAAIVFRPQGENVEDIDNEAEAAKTLACALEKDGERVYEETEETAAVFGEFSKEKYEKQAAFRGGQWLQMPVPFDFCMYLPATWYDYSEQLSEELLSDGYFLYVSPDDPMTTSVMARIIPQRDDMQSIEDWAEALGYTTEYDNYETKTVNGLAAASGTYLMEDGTTMYLVCYMDASGCLLEMVYRMEEKYEPYMETICDSVHTGRESQGAWADGVYISSSSSDELFGEASDTETIRQVQEALNAAGYDCGTADGIMGANTAQAILDYQGDHGLTADGQITDELLESLGL